MFQEMSFNPRNVEMAKVCHIEYFLFPRSGTCFLMNLLMNLKRVSCSCLDVNDGLYEEPFVRGTIADLAEHQIPVVGEKTAALQVMFNEL